MFSAKIIGTQRSLEKCIKQILYTFEISDKPTHTPQKHVYKVFQELKIIWLKLLLGVKMWEFHLNNYTLAHFNASDASRVIWDTLFTNELRT